MSYQTDFSALHRLQHTVRQFGTSYFCLNDLTKAPSSSNRFALLDPRRTTKTLLNYRSSKQSSPLNSSKAHQPVDSLPKSRKCPAKARSPPTKAIHNELLSYVDLVNRCDTLYMYQQTTPDMFGPKRHSFFVKRRSPAVLRKEESVTLVLLKELNSMARATEMSSGQYDPYPCYTPKHYAPNLSNRLRYGKGFSSPFIYMLRKKLNLQKDSSFNQAFPATANPRVTMHLGQPKIEKSVFNSLLEYKLSASRAYFHIQHTPKYLPRQIVQWINSVLRRLYYQTQSNVKTTSTKTMVAKSALLKSYRSRNSEQKFRQTLDQRFISAGPSTTDVPAPGDKAPVEEPLSPERHPTPPHVHNEPSPLIKNINYVHLSDVLASMPNTDSISADSDLRARASALGNVYAQDDSSPFAVRFRSFLSEFHSPNDEVDFLVDEETGETIFFQSESSLDVVISLTPTHFGSHADYRSFRSDLSLLNSRTTLLAAPQNLRYGDDYACDDLACRLIVHLVWLSAINSVPPRLIIPVLRLRRESFRYDEFLELVNPFGAFFQSVLPF
jgi:hypothetical protein